MFNAEPEERFQYGVIVHTIKALLRKNEDPYPALLAY